MLNIQYGRRFKKEFQKTIHQEGHTPEMFQTVLDYLVREQPLPEKYRDHKLTGDYRGYRECHISPDWLLIYKTDRSRLILVLARTGNHSDLF